MFTFLTSTAAVLDAANTVHCRGGLVTEHDVAIYSAYVAHVLAELATVTPTISGFQYAAVFPNDATGSVQGTATCDGTTDAGRCITCLSGLQQLLGGSCSQYEGGGARGGGMICGMAFDMVH
ncbi:unnamed protein product [Linum trigynum]